ncbi:MULTISPECIES: DUF1045 domain-containing protein [Alphaproteobacteria]|uniref:Phosphonate metabolism protein n=2 Tax=Alphaproteobacteria TaxID=28211 RepID=A0A512HIW7_9HYPH|nr:MULTISPECIES: DUF1045 domain-containing protein [Alphaproteobacteria]GEO85377.1 hypothetical protein RNA01_23090 [Ciceribacter naphthalenivorans]GLR21016.1 hypothetical protein GCM10007920_08010 [Ciceribacter naphthalenivorans]GLT03872.1 hypothetical protein GCM10007926_08010 [Sphingomonas psychrolutea]
MRYALYFTPPANDPLTRTASAWLGRDAFTEERYTGGPDGAFPAEDFAALTADPRRYGFHATLKAPFALAEGKTELELMQRFSAFCAEQPAFDIPAITVGEIGPFFALVPAEPCQTLQDFATCVVETFEPFRAPLSEADIARRKPERLSEAQRTYLMRWGYPYVMEEFRFHMTLSGPVEPAKADVMRQLAKARFSPFTGKPLHVSGLALFVEQERGAPFTVHTWQPLAGA